VAVEGPEDIDTLKLSARIGVVAQTTQSYGNFSEIVLKLLRLTNELRVFNTICNATTERQDAACSLSRVVDAMIVVGGRNSANTTRLASLCREEGRPTYHIEHADEIQPEWLTGVARVGVTAGASTPDWIIEAVVRRLAASEKKA
jgi:4-hydroxy-3-methylbut-2-enyl diphosphate reductase